MCGIAGIVGFEADMREEMKICENMQKTLLRRGPDQRGIVLTENVALIHTRLAVIDVVNGRQPMKFIMGEQTYIIVYNGELYNTAEIRRELEEDFEFETASDTEVVLKSFVKWG
ncbi:MAG: asparagine synthetase B, partial [Ruminococcus sp.]|nr:asparagine synthetase B [Ruminococcus sp.]